MNIKKGKIVNCFYCGQEKYFRQSYLIRYEKLFCSRVCSQKHKTGINHPQYLHGLKKTRFYRIWSNMRVRCSYSDRDNSKWYKEKGIKVCKGWQIFINFRKDMYESYLKHVKDFGEKQTTLDRINSSKNYIKNNCKWSTWKEQQGNKQIANLKSKGCKCKI